MLSQTLANRETQVGFPLFARSGRYPRLTEQGRALLDSARAAASSMDGFKAKARTLAEGLEAELSVAVDVMLPIARLTEAVGRFHREIPGTPLRLDVEALGAVPAQAALPAGSRGFLSRRAARVRHGFPVRGAGGRGRLSARRLAGADCAARRRATCH